jgi:hypothetical protein
MAGNDPGLERLSEVEHTAFERREELRGYPAASEWRLWSFGRKQLKRSATIAQTSVGHFSPGLTGDGLGCPTVRSANNVRFPQIYPDGCRRIHLGPIRLPWSPERR